MKSKLAVIVLIAALAGSAGYFAALNTREHSTSAGSPSAHERKIKFYQSPMHPWIKSDQPGKCTSCGMDLVPVYEGDAGFKSTGILTALTPSSDCKRPT